MRFYLKSLNESARRFQLMAVGLSRERLVYAFRACVTGCLGVVCVCECSMGCVTGCLGVVGVCGCSMGCVRAECY